MRRAGNILSRFSGGRVHRRDVMPENKYHTYQVAEKKRILRRHFRNHSYYENSDEAA